MTKKTNASNKAPAKTTPDTNGTTSDAEKSNDAELGEEALEKVSGGLRAAHAAVKRPPA